MMKHEKPIKPPFEAPEGYFEGFDARVRQKIARIGHAKPRANWSISLNYRYASVAAVLLAVMVLGLYKAFLQPEKARTNITQIANPVPQVQNISSDSATHTEEVVMQQWLAEAESQTVPEVNKIQQSREELSIEEELEAEGLIAMDVETGWMDENEILP